MTPDRGMGSISHQELESVESSGRRVQLADGQRGSKSKKEPRPEAEEMGSPAVDATQSLSLLMACVLRLTEVVQGGEWGWGWATRDRGDQGNRKWAKAPEAGGSLDGGASLSLSVTTGRLLAEQIDGEAAQEPQHRGLRNEGTTTGGHSEYGQLFKELGRN